MDQSQVATGDFKKYLVLDFSRFGLGVHAIGFASGFFAMFNKQNYSNSPHLASHKENAILRCNFKIHTGN